MNNHISNYLKIGVALIVAFIVTSISTSTLFYPSYPRLNPQFLANIAKLFQKKNPYDELKNLPLTAMKKVSKGIYAIEKPTLNTVFVRITKDAEWNETIIEYNGKRFKILLPKK